MRNFLYNKSDILVAVIIIVVAAIIIWTRVGAIMDTNSGAIGSTGTAIGQADTPEGQVAGDGDAVTPPAVSGGDAVASGTATTTATTTDATTPAATDAQPAAPKTVKFKIAEDATSEEVAEDLEADGLVESASDFSKRLVDRGKDTTIRGGTFKLKPGMSMDEIIDVIAG